MSFRSTAAKMWNNLPQHFRDIASYNVFKNPGGGGGTLFFFAYVGSDPASTVHPQKYQKFQAPQKKFEIFATPKNIPILYIYLKKRP